MAQATSPNSRIGSVLQGRYRITDELSRGGMGVVYRGERIALDRAVAIKFLHAAYSSQADFVERFEREAKLTSRLEHPNVVSTIDFGIDESPYIVMDFVAGQTLQDLLANGAVPPQRAIDITKQILAGLAHAHEHGIIHRDVKPANVMLTRATVTGDHVQLLDFGLAKMLDVDQTSASGVLGTPSYMSPEQASGTTADERTDIYSTGLVLFELLTGTKTFAAEGALALMRMHLDEPPEALVARKPDGEFSRELEEVVQTSLAKNRSERYQTPAEMLEALDGTPEMLGEGIVPATTRPQTRPQTRAPLPERARRGLGLAKWLALPLAAAAVWWIVGKPRPGDVAKRIEREAEPGSASKPAAKLDDKKPAVADKHALTGAPQGDDLEARIRLLHESLRELPGKSGGRAAAILLELGDRYFEKGWASEGLEAYKRALAGDRRLAKNATLNRNAISALAQTRSRARAQALIVKSIGKPALPFLRAAATAQPKMRREITALIRRLE